MPESRPAAETLRLAMWSGPRNVSTALMRSWGNRPDTFVIDEPLYAHYLLATGRDHPGRDEVIAHHETDCRKVAASLHWPVPPGVRIFYQKHMAHHLLPDIGREWLDGLTHAFLIRDPREMLLSLDQKLEHIDLPDTGLPQQLEVFEHVLRTTGATPPVVDAQDLLRNPRAVLGRLCDAVGVEFSEQMLSWPAGRRDTDGIWARYWYDQVERSTGFTLWRARSGELAAPLVELERQCRPIYERLHAHRLTIP
ncbi:MAG: hypothetical protein WCE48_01190 [Steroidobacteraceae bacterium]